MSRAISIITLGLLVLILIGTAFVGWISAAMGMMDSGSAARYGLIAAFTLPPLAAAAALIVLTVWLEGHRQYYPRAAAVSLSLFALLLLAGLWPLILRYWYFPVAIVVGFARLIVFKLTHLGA